MYKRQAQYRLDKNHDGYMECYNKLIKMGFNHYEVVAATNSVLNKMQDKTESGAKDAHDYLSFYKSDDLVDVYKRQRQYRKNLSEQKKQTEAKNKIRRLHKQMRQMLMKPKEGMYVPQDLVQMCIRDRPDSLGEEIDQMAREKAQELAKKSKYAKFESERQA